MSVLSHDNDSCVLFVWCVRPLSPGHNEPTTQLYCATTWNIVKSRFICGRRKTIARQSHDILSIVALSCVVRQKLDMHLFSSTIFYCVTALWLSWRCLTIVVRLSWDKHIVVVINIILFNQTIVARLSYDNLTTVARLSWYSRTIVLCITNFVRWSHNIDCLSYDSGTFVLLHIFVVFRRALFREKIIPSTI